ncbi:MAG: PHP-associated domain-containing protein [Candidatus Thermoplasmatota archaeon]
MAGRADPHVHTRFSGFGYYGKFRYPESMTTPEDAVDAAVRRGLQVLCITDHNAIDGALRAASYARGLKIEVVVGEEITTCDGELVGLFLQEKIEPHIHAEEAVEQIHAQGGLAIAVHPYSFHCPSLGDRIHHLRLDGVEVLNAAHGDGYVNRLAKERIPQGMAPLGGSDAHSARMIGNSYTSFEGDTAEEFYRAVKRCRTVPGGRTTRASEYIGWTVEIARGILRRMLTRSDRVGVGSGNDPHALMDRVRPRNRALITGGCLVFLTTPLPLIIGLTGYNAIRHRGRTAWLAHDNEVREDCHLKPRDHDRR